MNASPDTTTRNKSLAQMALDKMDQAARRYDLALLKWQKNRSDENLKVLEAAYMAYKQSTRTYQTAQLVVKYNHGRISTVRPTQEGEG